ncbi:DeoR family transcriptional regulator [Cohnella cholangitidis]|nr:HTH domain-containing protein [Cohnella cholangitidis]
MTDSYPFPMYSGIFEPKHYDRIGTALWFFSWCINSTTKESEEGDGVTWGYVQGSRPIKLSELAAPFGVSEKTVRRWIDDLEKYGYIRTKRAPYGLIIAVRNSKKRKDKNVQSDDKERTKMSDLSGGEWTETSDLSDKNVQSNKDFVIDLNTSSSVSLDQETLIKRSLEIESHFCLRRGRGFNVSPADFKAIQEIVAEGVPTDLIKSSIDRVFAEYKPKHQRDEIRTITYCLPRCYDDWEKSKQLESITSPVVPSAGLVALGTQRKTKNQQEIDELENLIREERERLETG